MLAPKNEHGACDDGLFCTVDDACAHGVCVGGTTRFCPSPDACHDGVCDETSRACVGIVANEGASCPPIDACHDGGRCTSGICAAGAPKSCAGLSNACALGACELAAGGCVATPINEGLPCDDGKGSACSYGHCASGACASMPTNEGGPCDDGLFCTIDDRCANGACVGQANPCAPTNGCYDGTCDEAKKACSITTRPDGTACGASDPCVAGRTCSSGACIGGSPSNEGGACDDGLSCTSGEACHAGACTGGAGPTIYFEDDFSTANKGWSLGPEWQIGAATASQGGAFGADPMFDHTLTDDNGIAGVVIGGNASTMVHPFSYLESPSFDASGAGAVVLGFYRWLDSDHTPFMDDTVEVFDGAAWTVVWHNGGAPIEDAPPVGAGWTYEQIDVTAFRSATMRVRFGFDVGAAGAFTCGSWNLDDVRVASAPCP